MASAPLTLPVLHAAARTHRRRERLGHRDPRRLPGVARPSPDRLPTPRRLLLRDERRGAGWSAGAARSRPGRPATPSTARRATTSASTTARPPGRRCRTCTSTSFPATRATARTPAAACAGSCPPGPTTGAARRHERAAAAHGRRAAGLPRHAAAPLRRGRLHRHLQVRPRRRLRRARRRARRRRRRDAGAFHAADRGQVHRALLAPGRALRQRASGDRARRPESRTTARRRRSSRRSRTSARRTASPRRRPPGSSPPTRRCSAAWR